MAHTCVDGRDGIEDDVDNQSFTIESKTWRKIEEHFMKDGYRDGLEIGEEQTVQAGHDEGFGLSSSFFHLSALRGVIAAVRCCLSSSTFEATESSSGLLKEVEDLESQILRMEQSWESASTESQQSSNRCIENCSTQTDSGNSDGLHSAALTCPLLDVVAQLAETAAQDLNFVSEGQYSNYVSLLDDVRRVVRRVNTAS